MMTIGEILAEQVKSFVFSRFCLELSFARRATLPLFLGATLRGGFGVAFKNAVCLVRHRQCERCLIKLKCPYVYLFETPRPEEAKLMTRYDKVPHPYLLEPPFFERSSQRIQKSLTFHCTLFGNATSLLPFFLLAMQQLGRYGLGRDQARFTLSSVEFAFPSSQTGKPLYDPHREELDPAACQPEPLCFPSLPTDPVPLKLVTVTPIRLKADSKLSRETLPFDKIVSSLLRRFSMISYFHCSREIKLDFRLLVQAAKKVTALQQDLRWQDMPRYSTRQQRKMNLGGLKGSVVYDAQASPFFPLLWLGQFLHVGKATSFGLGQYLIKTDAA